MIRATRVLGQHRWREAAADTVVLPAMAEHILATTRTATASWYDGVGHAPHIEAPDRFNQELAELSRTLVGNADKAAARSSR
jgi:pimeloyl-ACP methyl ester carboxylesterase